MIDGVTGAYAPQGAVSIDEPFAMNPDGSDLVQLTTSGGVTMPAWSPDGKKIAFASDRDGYIYVMAADGSSVVQITRD